MKDSVDRHVERWRGLEGVPFDDEIEGVVTRIQYLTHHLNRTTAAAIAGVGLQHYENDTLHALMVRQTPGSATPSELARRLRLSASGMTGRVDAMVEAGLLERTRSDVDRRKVLVTVTELGRRRWREGMGLRGAAEEAMVGVLTRAQQQALNDLLRQMLLAVESRDESHEEPVDGP